jgi:hypothetical protein
MYHARKERGHVGTYTSTLTFLAWYILIFLTNIHDPFLAWYIYMTPHFPGMIHIHDPSLSWHGTYT